MSELATNQDYLFLGHALSSYPPAEIEGGFHELRLLCGLFRGHN